MKTCAELALAAAALLLPALASAGLFGWPEPPLPAGTQAEPVAERIVFNGLDMRARVFRSSQGVQDIVDYYRKAWNGQVVVNKVGDATVIGHRDGDYFVTVQVSAAGSGSKGDIGIVDVASAPKQPELGKGLPRPMGSKVSNDIAYPDDPVPARTVAMRNSLSPQQNASFFRERLAGDGWKPAADGRCTDDGCVLSYARGDGKMTLVVARAGDGQSQVVINVQQP
jgi:hypothetical protein